MSWEFIYEDNDFVETPVDRLTIARAINKAHRRYAHTGDVEGALLWVALSLCAVKPSAETLAWAAAQVGVIEAERKRIAEGAGSGGMRLGDLLKRSKP